MKIMPQPDGRLAIIYTAEEDAVLERLGVARGVDSRVVATDIYHRLMRASSPEVVEAIGKLGPPR